MARNDHDRGVEVHYLRSLDYAGGAYTLCGHTVMDGRYSTLWDHVTCERCLVHKPVDTPKEDATIAP